MTHVLFLSFTRLCSKVIKEGLELSSNHLYFFGCQRPHVFNEMWPYKPETHSEGPACEVYWMLDRKLSHEQLTEQAKPLIDRIRKAVVGAELEGRCAWRNKIYFANDQEGLIQLLNRNGYEVTLAQAEKKAQDLSIPPGEFGINYSASERVLKELFPQLQVVW